MSRTTTLSLNMNIHKLAHENAKAPFNLLLAWGGGGGQNSLCERFSGLNLVKTAILLEVEKFNGLATEKNLRNTINSLPGRGGQGGVNLCFKTKRLSLKQYRPNITDISRERCKK